MRKVVIACLFLLLTSIFLIEDVESVYANSTFYESIDIHVQLNEDGSGKVSERWLAEIHEGTENFMIKENIGKSEIEDFTVSENEHVFDFVKKWDVDATREEKAFKNGIVKKKKDIELSWGIGEYGRHEYIVEYTVTNMIKQLKDAQTLYWTFSNPGVNIPRAHIRVEIEAPKQMNEKDESIWAFGYSGDVEFVNGNIVIETDQSLTKEEYVTILVEFDEDLFATKDKINKKFSTIQKEAFKGSDYDGPWSKIWNFIKGAAVFLGIIIMVVVLTLVNKGRSTDRLGVGKAKRFKRQFKEEYYRDYPYSDYYLDAYYFVYRMGLGSFNTILTSLLLKWIHNDHIRVTEVTSGMLNRKSQVITLLNDKVDIETDEGRLFHSIKKLTNDQGEVTDKELSNWADRNYKGLRNWEKSVMKRSLKIMESENYIYENKKKFLIFSWGKYELTDSGKQMEENIYKYVNYLHDFSLISERDAVNVKLWDEMMIWAAYLNLTDVVMKQFKKLYPKYVEETKLKEENVRRSSSMAKEVERRQRRREKAERRKEQRRRSSGGGGRASRGGGSGSFGGGRGGGIR